MGTKLNKEAYRQLVDEDIEFVKKHLPKGLERDHILQILNRSVETEYAEQSPETGQVDAIVIGPLPSDEDIEIKFPAEVGQSVKMEKGKTYEETRLANYHRRQGARWMRDLISNDQ